MDSLAFGLYEGRKEGGSRFGVWDVVGIYLCFFDVFIFVFLIFVFLDVYLGRFLTFFQRICTIFFLFLVFELIMMAEWEGVEGWDWGATLGKGLCGVVVQGSRVGDPEKTKVFYFFFLLLLLLLFGWSLDSAIILLISDSFFFPFFSKFAVKMVNLVKMYDVFRSCGVGMEKLEEVIEREISIMKSLSHPYVIGFDDNFRLGDNIFMVMEMIQGQDLLSALPSDGFAEEEAKLLYFQICCALAYCHSQDVSFSFLFLSFFFLFLSFSFFFLPFFLSFFPPFSSFSSFPFPPFFILFYFFFFSSLPRPQVIHGDVKLENVLVKKSDHSVKLIDFGFSQVYKEGAILEVSSFFLPIPTNPTQQNPLSPLPPFPPPLLLPPAPRWDPCLLPTTYPQN